MCGGERAGYQTDNLGKRMSLHMRSIQRDDGLWPFSDISQKEKQTLMMVISSLTCEICEIYEICGICGICANGEASENVNASETVSATVSASATVLSAGGAN
jgi:hypothetical protein